jgi:prolyl-tRNA synthetase
MLQVDGNDQKTPGWRFNYWELKGVPVRIEVGPRDVEQGVCVLARRDRPGEGDEGLLPQGVVGVGGGGVRVV